MLILSVMQRIYLVYPGVTSLPYFGIGWLHAWQIGEWAMYPRLDLWLGLN